MNYENRKNNYIILAEEFHLSGDKYKALKKYKQALKFSKDKDSKILILFRVALLKDELSYYYDAVEYYDKILELDSNQPGAYYGKAIAFEELLNYDEAIYNYKKAIKLNNKYDRAYFYLANLYDKMGNLDKAIEYYLKVINLVDDNIAYNNIAGIFEELGLINTSMYFVNQSLNIDDSYYKALYNKGVLLYSLNKPKSSILYYKKAMRVNPNFLNIYLNLSEIYLDLGDYVEAIDITSKGLQLEKNEDLYYNRACAYTALKNYDLALEDLKTSIDLNEDIKIYAKSDVDLLELKKLDEFEKIIK